MSEAITQSKNKQARIAARRELWLRGELRFKLDENQLALLDMYKTSNDRINVWLLSRRSGKSYTLLILALTECLNRPNTIVKYLAPTKLQVSNIIRPLLRQILEDCPEEIKPELHTKDYIYYFKNGSEIQMAGGDSGHAEKLRGGDAHLVLVDEAGSVDDLDYTIKSILLPTTLMTRGKVILASTPPKHYDHDFIQYIERSMFKNTLVKRTVYDNPRLTKKDIDDLIDEVGGKDSPDFRRELLCEVVKDESTSVLPEFNEDLKQKIVTEWKRPQFFDYYESMDLGFNDLTFIVYMYYDFRNDKIVVEDESVIDFKSKKIHLPNILKEIKDKEKLNFSDTTTGETRRPFLRVSDINPIVLNEINGISGGEVSFINAKKDDKAAALNQLRVMLQNEKIIINPKCKNLIRHLENVRWSSPNNRKTFARSPDDGHYDGVDALLYGVRAVVFGKNPYPKYYQYDLKSTHIVDDNPKIYNNTSLDGNSLNNIKSIFTAKRKRWY